MDTEGGNPYVSTLDKLHIAFPRLAGQLNAAEQTRAKVAALMLDGVRFQGLEELLLTLDHIVEAWGEDGELASIAFLVRRATADIETAIEAGLSGYPSVASDAMRDVMETELLMLYFYIEPARINEWLTADRSTRLRDFSPAAVRRRVIEAGLHEIVGTSRVLLDYQAHSEALHVTPVSPIVPFFGNGHVPVNDLITLDRSFIEVFEHSRRLGNALLLVAHRLSPDSAADRACSGPSPAFSLAYERTQEFAQQFLDLLQRQIQEIAPTADGDVPS